MHLLPFAVSLGLILNEAVTNSLKYAFPDGWIGTLNIIQLVEEKSKTYRFIIGDDGIGFPGICKVTRELTIS
ncbi:hypothetical protein Dfri01_48390 [Dyadobacter frigoris]|uniref:hypothetical protein n=1 Tax=Dyadobacter frigoris TaxID=2576211 RepID=UPI0024A0AD3E|nr:hypothetical protein [Dyadobacter frigoris]GLU55378.1 hypothetical protein Dfri01_48390 [Dyadobacter frigoris]